MKFLCDENFPVNLVSGLSIIEKSNHKSPYQGEIIHTQDLNISNYSDEEIIEIAGKQNAIIITQDKDFKHFKHYKELYKQHNVGVVVYKAYGGKDRYWDKVTAFVNQWEKIKKLVAESPRPFVIQFDIRGAALLNI
ncbi:MAG TPA: DUF5615 family PIN-like protein [Mucilaginibacter sp.]|nr:DUF5615 family PIN-like protein [Mucilaginibacter sp.]